MTAHTPIRGAEPLAHLSTMEPWEAALIRRLRSWCSSAAGRAQVIEEFAANLPAEAVGDEIGSLGRLISLIHQNAHRPLVHHGMDCKCAGADECVFAHLVKIASAGHLDDAAQVAALMVRPCFAEQIAILAAHVGQNARQMTGKNFRSPTKSNENVVRLH